MERVFVKCEIVGQKGNRYRQVLLDIKTRILFVVTASIREDGTRR